MREATIQKILDTRPAENSDNLDVVKVLGWQIVTKRNEFSVGDLICFVEIDSLLPDSNPAFEFLRNKKFRIKTVKLRGNLSQGIVFPMSILPETDNVLFLEDTDVSEILGIIHYEKPIPASLRGQIKGNFPAYVSRTDEPRIQSYPGVIEEFRGVECYSTVKCDGTSSSFINKDGDIWICSRNWGYKETNELLYWQIAKKFNIEDVLKDAGNIAIQGEICGPSIQKNRMQLTSHEIFIFDVWDIDKQEYFDFPELRDFCTRYEIPMVPLADIFIFNHTIEQLLEMAKGVYQGTQNRREGIVIRPTINRFSEALKRRLSVKILNNDYLLKDEE
jgi:RNA ligase (TIGR02306 family)